MAVSVRPRVYRGNAGYAVQGRPNSDRTAPSVSIFVRCRSAAVRIKKVLNAGLPWEERSARIARLIEADARVKVCRR